VAAPSDSKPTDLAGHAREQVCSGNDPAAAVGVYSPDFRDYINAREIRIWGIVISRVEDGEIVEDWAASDTLDLVRQLGPWRTLLLAISWLRRARRPA
jgi:hypothetical protein